METCIGRYESSEGRISSRGDTELNLNCRVRFWQSSKWVRAGHRRGGGKQPVALGATGSG